MLRLIELTEITGRNFSGGLATAKVYVNVEHIVAIKAVDNDKSLLVMQGAAALTVMGQPRDVAAQTRVYNSRPAHAEIGHAGKSMPLLPDARPLHNARLA